MEIDYLLKIRNYEHLDKFYDDLRRRYCVWCKTRTLHILRGFEGHNRRLECLKCCETKCKKI